MKNASLIACPGCARHVRVGENACPFCKASLGEATRAFVARLPPKERLSRSALYAFGVGSLTVATACGGSVANTAPPDTDASHADAASTGADDSGSDDAGSEDAAEGFDGSTIALYGGFVFDAGEDASDQDVRVAPPYGIAPPPDAGEPDADEADASSDATNVADVGVGVPYGIPPGK